MEELEVEVRTAEGARLPLYLTEGASGMDLFAHLEEEIELRPFERRLIPTGVYLSIPEGYEAEIRPRSGLAFEHGLTVLNAPGTVDSDYRGEVKVLLINLGDGPVRIKRGDRIAQIVFKRVVKARLKQTEVLSRTARGEGGFGSTGL
jgi:dUTP pyrophosphatase